MGLTDELRHEHHGLWEAMVTHPFVMELGDGTLAHERFQRYFLQDYAFLKDLTRLAGLLIARAPDFEAARRMNEFLTAVLSGEEEGLFRDEFQRWGLAPGVHAQPEPLPTTKAFGSYLTYLAYDRPWAEALMALCTTEWTYLDWATRLSLTGKAPANPAYRQWIEIHAVPPFADFVAWLRKRVEAEALQADTTRLAAVFRDCLRYECMFWEMAYHGESWPVPGGRKL